VVRCYAKLRLVFACHAYNSAIAFERGMLRCGSVSAAQVLCASTDAMFSNSHPCSNKQSLLWVLDCMLLGCVQMRHSAMLTHNACCLHTTQLLSSNMHDTSTCYTVGLQCRHYYRYTFGWHKCIQVLYYIVLLYA
jgi:hypothetical protein